MIIVRVGEQLNIQKHILYVQEVSVNFYTVTYYVK